MFFLIGPSISCSTSSQKKKKKKLLGFYLRIDSEKKTLCFIQMIHVDASLPQLYVSINHLMHGTFSVDQFWQKTVASVFFWVFLVIVPSLLSSVLPLSHQGEKLARTYRFMTYSSRASTCFLRCVVLWHGEITDRGSCPQPHTDKTAKHIPHKEEAYLLIWANFRGIIS